MLAVAISTWLICIPALPFYNQDLCHVIYVHITKILSEWQLAHGKIQNYRVSLK